MNIRRRQRALVAVAPDSTAPRYFDEGWADANTNLIITTVTQSQQWCQKVNLAAVTRTSFAVLLADNLIVFPRGN